MTIKNISHTILLCTLILFLMPHTSFGYFATERSATHVTDNTALYTIDFSFGFADKDVYIPIATERTTVNDTTNPLLGYTFVTSNTENTHAGTAIGLVISDMPIVDNMYRVSAGQRGHFTLVVALTVDNDDEKAKYSLQVTNLPYRLKQTTDTENLGLNIYELGAGSLKPFAYHTAEVVLPL